MAALQHVHVKQQQGKRQSHVLGANTGAAVSHYVMSGLDGGGPIIEPLCYNCANSPANSKLNQERYTVPWLPSARHKYASPCAVSDPACMRGTRSTVSSPPLRSEVDVAQP